MKWFFRCLVAVIIAAVAWIALKDFSSLDARSAISRATVVVRGHVVSGPRPQVVIDEIWKSSGSSRAVAVGTILPFPVRGSAADQVLVCFTPHLLSRQLSPSAILAIRHDRVGFPSISLSEVKVLCNVSPKT